MVMMLFARLPELVDGATHADSDVLGDPAVSLVSSQPEVMMLLWIVGIDH